MEGRAPALQTPAAARTRTLITRQAATATAIGPDAPPARLFHHPPGYHVAAHGAATSLLSLPYTLVMAPYRVLRFLTKSHDVGALAVTP